MDSRRKDEKAPEQHERSGIDEELDEALEATFPASDPVAVGHESRTADRPADRKPPVIDIAEVRRLARKLKDR